MVEQRHKVSLVEIHIIMIILTEFPAQSGFFIVFENF